MDRTASVSIRVQEAETAQQAYRIGTNDGLGNVFVWIEPAESDKYFEVPEHQLAPFKTGEALFVNNRTHGDFLLTLAQGFGSTATTMGVGTSRIDGILR